MPKLIIKTHYYKNPKGFHIDRYVRYIATRDGVEKQRGIKDNKPYTKAQQELMDKCIFTFPDTTEMPELQAFLDEPTRYRASELIDAVLDAHAEVIDLVDERKGNVWNHIMSLKVEDAARLYQRYFPRRNVPYVL